MGGQRPREEAALHTGQYNEEEEGFNVSSEASIVRIARPDRLYYSRPSLPQDAQLDLRSSSPVTFGQPS
jgi:hypothetical protein